MYVQLFKYIQFLAPHILEVKRLKRILWSYAIEVQLEVQLMVIRCKPLIQRPSQMSLFQSKL